MGLLDRIRQLFSRSTPREAKEEFGKAEAATWLAAMESGRLNVPRDVHDGEAWDGYWRAHIEVGPMEQGFSDMMSNDPRLIPFLDQRDVRTILCVGNGLSSEALALAIHGFNVTVLDISAIPRWRFDPDARIDPESYPPMHRTEARPPRGGGSLTSVTGDLMDADLCPGPFDVVIERRTVQLFPPAEQSAALDRLAARLAPGGLFVSHQHHGGWRPDQPRQHYASTWATEHGFTLDGASGADGGGRVARLVYTTG